MTTPTTLRLDYYGQVLSQPDEVPDLNARLFYRRLIAEEAEDGTIHIVPKEESMLSPVKPRANLGVRDGIIAEALRQGRTLDHRVQTRSYPELPLPVEIQPLADHRVCTHVLQFINQQERGVALLGTGVERCAIIAELVQAFPWQTFAVMTTTHGQSKTVQNKLSKLNIHCQRITSTSSARSAGRIVVGTFDSLRDRAVEIEKREVLIAYDAQQALADRAQQLLAQPDVCGRLYGFLESSAHLSPLQDEQLAATFGFNRVAVPAHGYQSVVVDANFVEYCGTGAQATKAIAVKRRGIWKDGHRNQLLAKLARAIAEADHETVSRFLPGYENRGLGEPERVALLTDSVEHIANLAKRLRRWPIRLDREYFDAGLPAPERRLLASGMSRWLTGEALITTLQGLSEVRPGSFDVMIWAGSGSGFPPIPWPHLVCPASSPRRLLLIDVQDGGHGLLSLWSRQRRRLYREVGWMDQRISPAFSRICRFLDRKNQEVER